MTGASCRTSIPNRRAAAACWSTSPRPPSTTPTASPPQNCQRPSRSYACRSYMSRNRTPRPFSQRSASAESPTSTRAIAGSPRPNVTRSMSAANAA